MIKYFKVLLVIWSSLMTLAFIILVCVFFYNIYNSTIVEEHNKIQTTKITELTALESDTVVSK